MPETTSTSRSSGQLSRILNRQVRQVIKQRGGIADYLRPQPLAVPGREEMRYLNRIKGMSERDIRRPEERMAMRTLRDLANPREQMGKFRDYFGRIVAPTVMNNAAMTTGARSGGALESMNRAGLEMTMPIWQESNKWGGQLAQLGSDLGQRYESRDLSRLNAGYQAAGVPRQAALDEIWRPGKTLLSLFGNTPGNTTTQTTQNTPGPSGLDRALQIGSILGQTAGAIF